MNLTSLMDVITHRLEEIAYQPAPKHFKCEGSFHGLKVWDVVVYTQDILSIAQRYNAEMRHSASLDEAVLQQVILKYYERYHDKLEMVGLFEVRYGDIRCTDEQSSEYQKSVRDVLEQRHASKFLAHYLYKRECYVKLEHLQDKIFDYFAKYYDKDSSREAVYQTLRAKAEVAIGECQHFFSERFITLHGAQTLVKDCVNFYTDVNPIMLCWLDLREQDEETTLSHAIQTYFDKKEEPSICQ